MRSGFDWFSIMVCGFSFSIFDLVAFPLYESIFLSLNCLSLVSSFDEFSILASGKLPCGDDRVCRIQFERDTW